MNLLPIAGTPGEAFLKGQGLDPAVLAALRFRANSPAIVAPLVDDLGIPRGAQLIELRRADGNHRGEFRVIGAAPGLTMRVRPWAAGPLVIARGLYDALAYASLRPGVAVWAVLRQQDRSKVAIPAGVSRAILPTLTKQDIRAGDLLEGAALAALGHETTVEAAMAESWLGACRVKLQREKTLARWEAEKSGPQSPTYYPDGTVWTYRHGLTRWRKN